MKTTTNDKETKSTAPVHSKTTVAAKSSTVRKSAKADTTVQRKNNYTGHAQSDFHTFFVDELKDIYWAELHLKRGLLKMCKASTSDQLTASFEKQYKEIDRQIGQLETVFALLGEKPEAKKCAAMEGLLEEVESIISDTKRNSLVRDAGLILAAQKVEHYEIATYGTLQALAEYLPEKKVQRVLHSLLEEEKKCDASLTKLAESFINECAAVE